MLHSCCFKYNFSNFKFISALFLTDCKCFNYVNGFYLRTYSFSLSSEALYNTLKVCGRKITPHEHCATSRKILDNDLYSHMSELLFSNSADVRSSSASDESPGSYIESLSNYVIIKDIKTYSSMSNEPSVTLKVLNHNILSQDLLHRHRYLYKRQKSFMLDWEYRKKRIEKDIAEINPDIFCLQEVEEEELPFFFKDLERLGYRSIIKMKTNNKGEGLAIYYRPSIKMKQKIVVEFSQPGVLELETRDQVGLIGIFEKGGKEFIVANTHLLYNPKRTEVRLAQLQIMLAEIHRVTSMVDAEAKSRILLMGDFNSTPESPVIKFILEGKLFSEYKPLPPVLGISPETKHLERTSKLYNSEYKNNSPTPGSPTFSIRPSFDGSPQKYNISHPFKFKSAYEVAENEGRGVTTYQDDWVMVDYIFHSKGFELLTRLQLPTWSDCDTKVHYLPNKYFPSDHLPLAAEFEIL